MFSDSSHLFPGCPHSPALHWTLPSLYAPSSGSASLSRETSHQVHQFCSKAKVLVAFPSPFYSYLGWWPHPLHYHNSLLWFPEFLIPDFSIPSSSQTPLFLSVTAGVPSSPLDFPRNHPVSRSLYFPMGRRPNISSLPETSLLTSQKWTAHIQNVQSCTHVPPHLSPNLYFLREQNIQVRPWKSAWYTTRHSSHSQSLKPPVLPHPPLLPGQFRTWIFPLPVRWDKLLPPYHVFVVPRQLQSKSKPLDMCLSHISLLPSNYPKLFVVFQMHKAIPNLPAYSLLYGCVCVGGCILFWLGNSLRYISIVICSMKTLLWTECFCPLKIYMLKP